eukprot:6459822-Pyramimonas_sp.AAC.1
MTGAAGEGGSSAAGADRVVPAHGRGRNGPGGGGGGAHLPGASKAYTNCRPYVQRSPSPTQKCCEPYIQKCRKPYMKVPSEALYKRVANPIQKDSKPYKRYLLQRYREGL